MKTEFGILLTFEAGDQLYRRGVLVTVDEVFLATQSRDIDRMFAALALPTFPEWRFNLLAVLIRESRRRARRDPHRRAICKAASQTIVQEWSTLRPESLADLPDAGSLPIRCEAFEVLAIFHTQDGETESAAEICRLAIAQGIEGRWARRLQRLGRGQLRAVRSYGRRAGSG